MIRGSCLCRTVRWSFDGAFDWMSHCHCEMCRKAHGAPFATYAIGSGEHFRFDRGEDAVTRYESSPGFVRAFLLVLRLGRAVSGARHRNRRSGRTAR